MTKNTLPQPKYIDKQKDLENLAHDLANEPKIAIDTESNSLYAYQEQVCLIQFSTPTQDYLLDPLALPNLDILAPIFANPKIEKVFHAAEYDLICLKRDFDFHFVNLFDTLVAARILGYTKVGLGNLLAQKFGVK
ncbi:MAG TPA: ribonuclease D, partial [Anaerolineales bacterium]|nr:ribonuclease D [Anaerolineales bacterium]